MADELWKIREEYKGAAIDPSSVDADPLVEVRRWVKAAVDAKIPDANAMTLATVDERGRPSARVVLLKELDARGFTFFTNYDSKKGRDLAAHPFAALVLFWEPMHRQVRVEGSVEQVTAAESDAYFASRPRGSQLGSAASPQSQVIASRAVLDANVAAFGDGPVPRPAHWGGYRVIPEMIELWQGQPSRMHDRVRYARRGDTWVRERLAP